MVVDEFVRFYICIVCMDPAQRARGADVLCLQLQLKEHGAVNTRIRPVTVTFELYLRTAFRVWSE